MTRAKTALVFAGGLGSRMAATRADRPKPLIEVAGTPLLRLLLRRLLAAGFEDVRLALRHRADEIRAAVLSFPEIPPARLTFLVETEPLGTIGALARLRDADGAVLTVNGDLLTGLDFAELAGRHARSGAALTIAVHEEHRRLRFGEVVADAEGRVRDYLEKPVKTYRLSSGVYVFAPAARALLSDEGWTPFPDLVRRAVVAGLDVREFFHDEPWFDVNDAADLAAADEALRRDPAAFGVDPEPKA